MSASGIDIAPKVGSPLVGDRPSIASGWSHRNWWVGAVLCAALLGVIYYDALAFMVSVWVDDENYGRGRGQLDAHTRNQTRLHRCP